MADVWKTELTIVKLPSGGYVVTDGYRPEVYTAQLIACSTIDEALDFIKEQMSRRAA